MNVYEILVIILVLGIVIVALLFYKISIMEEDFISRQGCKYIKRRFVEKKDNENTKKEKASIG
jgi:hypothetical protein